MRKTGSSSIQTWLGRHVGWLAERGITVLAGSEGDVPDSRQGAADLGPYRAGEAAANRVFEAYGSDAAWNEAVLERFFARLESAATRNRITVVSAEVLDRVFAALEPTFIRELERLAGSHAVRVATTSALSTPLWSRDGASGFAAVARRVRRSPRMPSACTPSTPTPR
jgi:hypothetical protein